MAILSKPVLEHYQYGVHVQKGRQLYMMSDKKIHFGHWLIKSNQSKIIIIEMGKQIAEREEPFFLEINGHDHIIRTFGSVDNSLNLSILVQEHAPQGDLASCLMDDQFHFTQSILLQMFVQITDAMSYVASKRIVHGDLGCRNVLVFRVDADQPAKSLVKITDFGLARWLDQPPVDEDKTVVPIRWCAPEILRQNSHENYSESSDVYSMGVLIWEGLSKSEMPYLSVEKDEDVKRKKINDDRLPQPDGCDRQLWVIINSCWHRDPQQRPTFDLIKEKLSNLRISDIPYDLITSSSHKTRLHYEYQLDIDVRIRSSQKTHRGAIHQAQWISKGERDGENIVLIERNDELSEYEQSIYSTFKDHPHIIRTYGFVENDRGTVMILQEQPSHGDLLSLLQNGQFQPSAAVLKEIFLQIIRAMIDIANHDLVHGDLCCENIFVFQMHPTDPKKNLVKLANFAMAHPNDPSYKDDRQINVPVRYCDLKILRSAGRSNYSEMSDVYSMGVLMWQAYSQGKRPYDSSESKNEVRQRKEKGERLSRPIACHELIWEIIADCWHNETTCRYNFKDMKTRFKNIGSQSIEQYQYELNKDIKQNCPLTGSSGRFYEAEWIPKKNPPVTLLVLDGLNAEHEARFHIELQHSHIIDTLGLVKNDQQLLMLLQERAPHGDLQRLLHRDHFQPSAEVLRTIFLQIIDVMIYLTEKNIVHADLRCENILVFKMDTSEPSRNLVKLTGFSLARKIDTDNVEYQLADSQVRCSAPEILGGANRSTYSEVSDAYSMGVLMWVAFSKGEVPYGHRTSDDSVRQKILNRQRLSRPTECPKQLWPVIEHCWTQEPSIRSNFEYLQKHLLQIDLKNSQRVICHHCNETFFNDELDDHQKSCIPPMSPIIDVDPHDTEKKKSGYVNPGYLENDPEDHPKKPAENPGRSHGSQNPFFKPKADIRPRSPSPKPPPVVDPVNCDCKYCGDSYPIVLIDEHERTQCPKRLPPRHVASSAAPQLYKTCDTCRKRFTIEQIIDHQRTCRVPSHGPIVDQPRSQEPRTPRPLPLPNPPKAPVQPPAQSWWARLCPCLRS